MEVEAAFAAALLTAQQPSMWRGGKRLAEGEGFEPPVPFRVQWFSRPPPSTTRPSLRGGRSQTLYAASLFHHRHRTIRVCQAVCQCRVDLPFVQAVRDGLNSRYSS